MIYSVELKPAAKRQFTKLPKTIAARLQAKIDVLAEEPCPHDHKKFKGFKNRCRIRIGDYRVIYEIHDDVLMLIVKVGPRRDIC